MSPTTVCSAITLAVLLLADIVAALPQHTRRLATEADAPEWTYRRTANDGEEPYGPSNWYIGYPDCSGDAQSPINLAADVETVVKASEFDLEIYRNVCMSDQLSFHADERVWEIGFTGCNETPHLSFDGDAYHLVQMHIHSPSEHMIGGCLHDAEIHLVHIREGTDADLLVVGIFLDAGAYGSNVEIQNLWDVLDIGTATTEEVFETKVYDLLPANPAYSHYMGSLTTPPCTEGVKWIVMTEPIVIGKMQLEEFRTSVAIHDYSKVDEMSNTNRPVQSLNDRDVYFV